MSKHESKSEIRRIDEVRQQNNNRILDAYPEIIDAIIEQAKNGSYLHAKFLFEQLETPAVTKSDDDDSHSGPSLAEILLSRLTILEAEDEAEQIAAAHVARA
jgi:hypothetical protein